MVVYELSIRHILSYQYMVGILPGNALLKALRATLCYVLIIRKVSYRQYHIAVGIIKGIIPGIVTI